MNLYDTLFSGAWIEQGGGGSGLSVPLFSMDSYTPDVFTNISCSMTYEELDALMSANGGSYACAFKIDAYFGGQLVSSGYSGATIFAEEDPHTTIYASDNGLITLKYDNDGTITVVE